MNEWWVAALAALPVLAVFAGVAVRGRRRAADPSSLTAEPQYRWTVNGGRIG